MAKEERHISHCTLRCTMHTAQCTARKYRIDALSNRSEDTLEYQPFAGRR